MKIFKSIKSNYDFPAVITKEKTYSYREIDELSGRFAFSLKDKIQSHEYIPLLAGHDINFILSVLALWKLNAVPVPINSRLSDEEKITLIKFTSSSSVINLNDKPLDDLLLRNQIQSINKIRFSEKEISADEIAEEETGVVIFTSGTTGKPKGVELSFNNLFSSFETGNKILHQTKDDRWLASLPFYHIGGFQIFVRAFLSGASVVISSSLKTENIAESIAEFHPALASFVTMQLKRLIEAGVNPNKIKTALIGGGFIEEKLIKEAYKKGWNCVKVYGSSETASFITALTREDFEIEPGSAGRPLPPNEIKILDESGNELLPNNSGEIAVKSPAVMKSYLYDEEETKKKFQNDFYLTGDIGYLNEDGFLFIEARRTDLIISGGENINPFEVEAAIIQHPKIKEACVVGIEDKDWGHIAAAAIVSEKDLDEDELRNYLKEKIASYKIPKRIIFIDELPKTSLGKVKREEVRKSLSEK